jgi:hypothetical protein
MAEINIQRKKKPAWPWVILVLVILVGAMVWYWKYYDNPTDNKVIPHSTGYRQTLHFQPHVSFQAKTAGFCT